MIPSEVARRQRGKSAVSKYREEGKPEHLEGRKTAELQEESLEAENTRKRGAR